MNNQLFCVSYFFITMAANFIVGTSSPPTYLTFDPFDSIIHNFPDKLFLEVNKIGDWYFFWLNNHPMA